MDHEIKSYILNCPFHIGVYVSQVEEYVCILFMKIIYTLRSLFSCFAYLLLK